MHLLTINWIHDFKNINLLTSQSVGRARKVGVPGFLANLIKLSLPLLILNQYVIIRSHLLLFVSTVIIISVINYNHSIEIICINLIVNGW